MARAEILSRGSTCSPEKYQSDFRLEYGRNSSDQALFDDVVSYLGEYRFNLPKYSYTLKYSGGKLRDPHKGDSMQDVAQRSIEKKLSDGCGPSREHAEKLGVMSLDRQLMSAKENDTVFWASPPGPQEEGYGNYGFIFIGHVKINHLSEKTVQMTAIRLEDPKIEQYNRAMYLLTGKKTDYKSAEEFIANSEVVDGYLSDGYADALLRKTFSFKPNEEEQRRFGNVIAEMTPLIREFIQSVKDPQKTKAEKRREFNALENYALELKRKYDHTPLGGERVIFNSKSRPMYAEMVGKFGDKKAPEVSGSCPGNKKNKNSLNSSNLLSQGSFLNGLLGEDEMDYDFEKDGPCVKCSADVKCGPCGICRACDLSIRAGAKMGLN